MEALSVIVDHELFEKISYHDDLFPIQITTDIFNHFIDGTVNLHWHDEFEFCYVLTGDIEFYINEECYYLHEGEGAFVNAYSLHMARQITAGAVMFDVVFPASFFSSHQLGPVYSKYVLPIIESSLTGTIIRPDSRMTSQLLGDLQKLYQLNHDILGYELYCMNLGYGIWLNLLNHLAASDQLFSAPVPKSIHNERMRLMLSFIHSHYPDKITVDLIAAAANISRTECFRSFKRLVGKSPIEYLNEYRLACAARMLIDTDRSITDICYACGFNNTAYFGKLFRIKSRISPQAFRLAKTAE